MQRLTLQAESPPIPGETEVVADQLISDLAQINLGVDTACKAVEGYRNLAFQVSLSFFRRPQTADHRPQAADCCVPGYAETCWLLVPEMADV